MVIKNKDFFKIIESLEEQTILFCEWFVKKYKKSASFKETKTYILRNQNKVVADEFTLKEIFIKYKEKIYIKNNKQNAKQT